MKRRIVCALCRHYTDIRKPTTICMSCYTIVVLGMLYRLRDHKQMSVQDFTKPKLDR
jgi:hypothetical protein